MADGIVKLTRELIKSFAQDHRTIAYFERLQEYVVDALPVSLAALFTRVDQAAMIADDSLAMSQQALAKADKQDLLLDVPLPWLKAPLQLLDVPVHLWPERFQLNDVPVRGYTQPQLLDIPVNSDRFERQLLDVPALPCCDPVLPDLMPQQTDTRKYDHITSSYGSRWVGSSSSLTVNTSEVDLTAVFGTGTMTDVGLSPFRYDAGVNAFFVSLEYVDPYFFDIVLRLSGTSPSPASQSQGITFFLRRTDGSLITTADYVVARGLPAAFERQVIYVPTFVFAGGADPYQVQGFRISAAGGVAGWDLTDKTLFLKR